jgi:hypothetical protein
MVQKSSTEESYRRKTFAHSNKSFFASFSTDSKATSNYAFFDTHTAFLKKAFMSYLDFLQTLIANADETAKKMGELFL